MPIKNLKIWKEYVEGNKSRYGKFCVDVAREIMVMMDEVEKINCYELMDVASKGLGGMLTGFMTGCVAQTISLCHSRGEEFRKKWNIENQFHNEGESANKKEGVVLNPSLWVTK
jgi:hypothetical protein